MNKNFEGIVFDCREEEAEVPEGLEELLKEKFPESSLTLLNNRDDDSDPIAILVYPEDKPLPEKGLLCICFGTKGLRNSSFLGQNKKDNLPIHSWHHLGNIDPIEYFQNYS